MSPAPYLVGPRPAPPDMTGKRQLGTREGQSAVRGPTAGRRAANLVTAPNV
jgi:hypothetical protein